MTHLRRRGRFGSLVRDPREEIAPAAVSRSDEEALDRDEVARALETLAPGLRTPVVLKDMYGLSCREIAEEMGLTEGAVKVRLHRARKRLKESIYGASRHAV